MFARTRVRRPATDIRPFPLPTVIFAVVVVRHGKCCRRSRSDIRNQQPRIRTSVVRDRDGIRINEMAEEREGETGRFEALLMLMVMLIVGKGRGRKRWVLGKRGRCRRRSVASRRRVFGDRARDRLLRKR